MKDIQEIKFGDTIRICFPDGDFYYLNTEDIAEICSRYFYIQTHELLSPDINGYHSIDCANKYKSREKQAIKYIKRKDG